MKYQSIFKRQELKYLITDEQYERLIPEITARMIPDRYGATTVRNLYYDTDTYLLIRRSIEKPEYKEKLRLRSYERANGNVTVFIELKKKYLGTVYKRRMALSRADAEAWLCDRSKQPPKTQISTEIEYFLDFYGSIKPRAFISYERAAFVANDGSDLRVTFDTNVLFRQTELSLGYEAYGTPLLPQGLRLMEIKCSTAIPLWLTELLSRERIYKTSFSKYGTAYREYIFKGHGGQDSERII